VVVDFDQIYNDQTGDGGLQAWALRGDEERIGGISADRFSACPTVSKVTPPVVDEVRTLRDEVIRLLELKTN
jgi:hypothetical protein